MKIKLKHTSKQHALPTFDGTLGENGVEATGFRVQSDVHAGAAWSCRLVTRNGILRKKQRECHICIDATTGGSAESCGEWVARPDHSA